MKRIFELYLAGNGVRKIQDIMEQEGRKTATGLTRWQSGYINRMLSNSIFLIIWFKRKSIIMEMLKRFMWKAPMRNLYHLKILTGLRS
ncbi:recombinase family protein [Clostridium sp. AM54-14XD]|uniref:recombinase family protein n=1 Tax=Clostridium sp. AM54-14XD TaxID=2293037 RepID=UPI001FA9E5DE|nr:recombinase family protein [Clostridium sp. AM54-14XD]